MIFFPFFRFMNFPDQPIVWREISVITAALRSDSQDKHAQFLRGESSLTPLLEYTSHVYTSIHYSMFSVRSVNVWNSE